MPGQRSNRHGLGCKTHAATTGAVSVTNYHDFGVHVVAGATSGAGGTLALPDGTHYGQETTLKAASIASTAFTFITTPANLMDGTTITFDASYEYAVLKWDGSQWMVTSTNATVA